MTLRACMKDPRAQTGPEYVLILALLALLGWGAVELFRAALAESFQKTAKKRAGALGILP